MSEIKVDRRTADRKWTLAIENWLEDDENLSWDRRAVRLFDTHTDLDASNLKGREAAVCALAEELKRWHDAAAQGANLSGFVGELVELALVQVNWREIAAHLISDNCGGPAKGWTPEKERVA